MSANTKRWIRNSVAAVVLVVVGVVVNGFFNAIPPPPDLTKEIFGREEIRTRFATAQTATAQTLQLRDESGSPRALRSYNQGPKIAVPPATLKELQQLFQKRSSFKWNMEKSCIPDYGILLTFHSPTGDVEIALCFKCAVFAVFVGDTEVNAEEDFDPIFPQFLALVKAMFPNEQLIKDL